MNIKDLSRSNKKSNSFGGFTKVPNLLIRSRLLNVYEKLILITIMSFNPRFPSYKAIMDFTGIRSRNLISKTIKSLVTKNLLRYQRGGSEKGLANEYKVYWDDDYDTRK